MSADRFPLDRSALCRRILELQEPTGRIRWIEGGLWDPWNQTESTMGLAVAGCSEAARRALDHLAEAQDASGAWTAEMGCAAPLDDANERLIPCGPSVVDTNFAAYCATGIWHVSLALGAPRLLDRHASMVARAMAFVLDHQRSDGMVAWRAREPNEAADDVKPLLAASSSIFKSLECAIRIWEALNRSAADWIDARERLGAAIRRAADAPPSSAKRHAMDWYYPVLAGALSGSAARRRLARGWRDFVQEGPGCRCVAEEPWVTAAETAELAMALAAAGAPGLAGRMLSALSVIRTPDGDAWMGWQHAEGRPWPLERPSWTAGAILIADDVVRNDSPAATVFRQSLRLAVSPAG